MRPFLRVKPLPPPTPCCNGCERIDIGIRTRHLSLVATVAALRRVLYALSDRRFCLCVVGNKCAPALRIPHETSAAKKKKRFVQNVSPPSLSKCASSSANNKCAHASPAPRPPTSGAGYSSSTSPPPLPSQTCTAQLMPFRPVKRLKPHAY